MSGKPRGREVRPGTGNFVAFLKRSNKGARGMFKMCAPLANKIKQKQNGEGNQPVGELEGSSRRNRNKE